MLSHNLQRFRSTEITDTCRVNLEVSVVTGLSQTLKLDFNLP